MRKLTTIKKSSSSTLIFMCPHCEGLNVKHKSSIMSGSNEITRENLTDTTSYITYNFNCSLCEGELQAGVEIDKNNQIIN